MMQMRGLGLPWCSAAQVGEQCVPDGTIPLCSVAPVGAQCTPDPSPTGGGSGAPSTGQTNYGSGIITAFYNGPTTAATPPVLPIVGAGGGATTPTQTNITPGTIATTAGGATAMPGFLSQMFTTWWGLGLLGLGGYVLYKRSKKAKA